MKKWYENGESAEESNRGLQQESTKPEKGEHNRDRQGWGKRQGWTQSSKWHRRNPRESIEFRWRWQRGFQWSTCNIISGDKNTPGDAGDVAIAMYPASLLIQDVQALEVLFLTVVLGVLMMMEVTLKSTGEMKMKNSLPINSERHL